MLGLLRNSQNLRFQVGSASPTILVVWLCAVHPPLQKGIMSFFLINTDNSITLRDRCKRRMGQNTEAFRRLRLTRIKQNDFVILPIMRQENIPNIGIIALKCFQNSVPVSKNCLKYRNHVPSSSFPDETAPTRWAMFDDAWLE